MRMQGALIHALWEGTETRNEKQPWRLDALICAQGAGTATRLVKRAKATHAKIALGASTGMSQQQEVWVQGALIHALGASTGLVLEKPQRLAHALHHAPWASTAM